MNLLKIPLLAVLILYPSWDLWAQSDTGFSKISATPSFPYANGWRGGGGTLSVNLSDTRVLWFLSGSYVSHKTKARKRKKAWTIVNNVVALSDFEVDPAGIHNYWGRARRDRSAYFKPEQTPRQPGYDHRHFCYLARTHSTFYDSRSRKLLLSYDCNSTEFLHAAGSDFIYIPRVLNLDVPEELR